MYRESDDSQLIERFKTLAEEECNRDKFEIEMEIVFLSKENINFFCKLIKSSSHIQKVILTAVEG